MKKIILYFLTLSLVTQSYAQTDAFDKAPLIDPNEFKVLLETSTDPMFQHPVNKVSANIERDYQSWKNWPIMKMSKEEILKLIPQQVGLLHLGCPECNAGPKYSKTDFNDNAQLPRQWPHWQWDPKNPEQYSCKKCGEQFPINKKYPMTKVDRLHNRLGEVIERYYWLDTAKDKKGFAQQRNRGHSSHAGASPSKEKIYQRSTQYCCNSSRAQ